MTRALLDYYSGSCLLEVWEASYFILIALSECYTETPFPVWLSGIHGKC